MGFGISRPLICILAHKVAIFFYAHSIYQAYEDLKMAMKVCFLPSYVHIQAHGGNIELDEQELSGHKWNKCTVASGTNPSLIAIQSYEYQVYISGDANYRKETLKENDSVQNRRRHRKEGILHISYAVKPF